MRSLFRVIGCATVALSLSGCMTLFGDNVISIDSVPPGALVTVEGAGECETPCTIQLESARRVTVAKAGYKSVRIMMEPDANDVIVALSLAAPTEDVDAVALPDLE